MRGPLPLHLVEQDAGSEEWTHRQTMFHTAMGPGGSHQPYNNIFSLSIKPTDPAIRQTLYFRNGFDAGSCLIPKATLPIRGEFTPPVFITGLLKPYPTFFHPGLLPELDSEICPEHVQKHKLTKEEDIDPALRKLQPRDLRERVKTIAFAFLNDPHAKEFYIITLQPFWTPDNPIHRNLFLKA